MTMRWRSPPDSRSRRASGNGDPELWDRVSYGASRNPLQLGPGILAALRVIWGRQARPGFRLPGQRGAIVIEGGAP